MAEQNALEALGLPASFMPLPAQVQFAKIGAPGADGVQTLHVMIIETPIGRLGFCFDATGFRNLGNAMVEQATGLTLASTAPASDERHNGHRP